MNIKFHCRCSNFQTLCKGCTLNPTGCTLNLNPELHQIPPCMLNFVILGLTRMWKCLRIRRRNWPQVKVKGWKLNILYTNKCWLEEFLHVICFTHDYSPMFRYLQESSYVQEDFRYFHGSLFVLAGIGSCTGYEV